MTNTRCWCPACGLPGSHADWTVCVQQLRRTAELMEKANRKEPDVIPRRATPITQKDVEDMRRRRADGESFPSIAREFGLHHTTVMHHVKKHPAVLEPEERMG